MYINEENEEKRELYYFFMLSKEFKNCREEIISTLQKITNERLMIALNEQAKLDLRTFANEIPNLVIDKVDNTLKTYRLIQRKYNALEENQAQNIDIREIIIPIKMVEAIDRFGYFDPEENVREAKQYVINKLLDIDDDPNILRDYYNTIYDIIIWLTDQKLNVFGYSDRVIKQIISEKFGDSICCNDESKRKNIELVDSLINSFGNEQSINIKSLKRKISSAK